MAIKNDYLKEIEYITFYPNKSGEKTLIATAITVEGWRVMLYAPSVSTVELSLNSTNEYNEVRDARNIPIAVLPSMRTLKIEGTGYLIKGPHNEREPWFLKVLYLDGPQSKPIVKKEEVEKLFGCQIYG